MKKSVVKYFYWFVNDKDGRLAVFEFPNLPIIIWFGGLVLSHAFTQGRPHQIMVIASVAGSVVWAVLEVISGRSPFRRVLGLAILAIIVANRVS